MQRLKGRNAGDCPILSVLLKGNSTSSIHVKRSGDPGLYSEITRSIAEQTWRNAPVI